MVTNQPAIHCSNHICPSSSPSSQSIDEFSRTHALTLGAIEQLLVLLAGHKALRPTDADVELKKSAQLHTHVQRSIEAAIEMGKQQEEV